MHRYVAGVMQRNVSVSAVPACVFSPQSDNTESAEKGEEGDFRCVAPARALCRLAMGPILRKIWLSTDSRQHPFG
jgi:hypothetical protein